MAETMRFILLPNCVVEGHAPDYERFKGCLSDKAALQVAGLTLVGLVER